MMRRTLLLLMVLPLVPGCAPFDERLGESRRINAQLQIINPQPVFAGDVIEGGSGNQAAAAARRYRQDKVKALETVRTSKVGTGMGSGSSGGESGVSTSSASSGY